MRAEDLVFWIDRLPDVPDSIGGVLCRRHADSMVVPRGWTLDDLRDPNLHLFRPPTPLPPPQRPRRAAPRRDRRDVADPQQLELDADTALTDTALADAALADAALADSAPTDAALADDHQPAPEPDEEPGPWTPAFDEADDLDGLLTANSPLLARAFRTAERPGPGH